MKPAKVKSEVETYCQWPPMKRRDWNNKLTGEEIRITAFKYILDDGTEIDGNFKYDSVINEKS